MARINLQLRNKVKQVVTVKRTLRFTAAGTAVAALILGFFFFTGNMTQSSDVLANKVGEDTLITHTVPNTSTTDSLVNLKKKPGVSSEDADHVLKSSDIVTTTKKAKKKTTNNNGDRSAPFTDFISISPKKTTGVFEVRFEIPSEQTGNSSINIVDRKGNVIETRELQSGSGIVNEVFTMGSQIPSGVYLVKINSGKNQYIRQVIYKKA